MGRVVPGSEEQKRINTALETWRQGDCALDEQWFLHLADGSNALTAESSAAGEGTQAISSDDAHGLVVLTQTCDVVRDCLDRPFVEVAPIVEVTPDRLNDVRKGRRPSFGFIPALAEQNLVADLDRTMTVEKSLLAEWSRTPGCRTDGEARAFATALARKRVRAAFPDDFVALVGKLQSHAQKKHDRDSDDGKALKALREIRVQASPHWESDPASLWFWFIVDDTPDDERPTDENLKRWLALVPAQDRFATIEGQITTLDDMTARDYVDSDPLDLDHLTTRQDPSDRQE